MKSTLHFIAAAALAVCSIASQAAAIAFVPPNDTTGQVFTTNSNDAWSAGRGIGFTVAGNQTLSSVGLRQNLRGINLGYGVYEISSLTGNFSKNAVLASGSSLTTTSGLDWVDFSFADITLTSSKNYLIEFSFTGNSQQNFFYNNRNVAWNQGNFRSLEGTSSNGFGNFVVGAFRVNGAVVNAVPEPGALALIGVAFAGMLVAGRRKA